MEHPQTLVSGRDIVPARVTVDMRYAWSAEVKELMVKDLEPGNSEVQRLVALICLCST